MSSIVERCGEKPCVGYRAAHRCWPLLLWLAIAAVLPAARAQVAPPNDNFVNATVLTGGAGSIGGSTVGATIEPGEPYHYYLYRLHSVWFRWVAPTTGYVSFDTSGSLFDTLLAAYQGTNVAQLLRLASNDDYPGIGLDSLITFFAVAGAEYRIAVDGYAGQSGPYQLNWYQAGGGPGGTLGSNEVVFSSSSYAVQENTPGFITVTVTSGGGFTNTSTVDFYTVDGTAVAGVDYLSVSNTLTWEPGDTVKTFTIPILDNSVQESNRTINLVLANPTGDAALGVPSNSVVTIIDDETAGIVTPAGQLNIVTSNYFGGVFGGSVFYFGQNLATIVTEDETFESAWGYVSPVSAESVKGALVTVSRTAPAQGRIMVDYYTTNTFLTNYFGTNFYFALPNTDYQPVSGTLVFDDYQMMANFIVPVAGYTFSTATNVSATPIFFDVVLANPRPAPEEDPAVIQPTIGVGQASVEILKINNYAAYSIERRTYRANEYDSFARGGTNVVNSNALHYVDVDIILPNGGCGNCSVDLYVDTYAYYLQPGSDYADPITQTLDDTPYTDGRAPIVNVRDHVGLQNIFGGGNLVQFQVTVPFPNANVTRRTVRIFITNDVVAEFNEDIGVFLTNPQGVRSIGNGFATATILYDDQPAGAADREWNPEGVLFTNPRYNQTPGANNSVAAVAVQPDDKTLIGGDFTHYNSFARNHLARINFDGSLDTTFNPGGGANAAVETILLYSTNSVHAGKILIGGQFTSYNGTSRNRIARVLPNGVLDTTFAPGNAADAAVHTAAIQSDDKVIVAGDFTTFNDLNVNGIMRVNADGSLDPTFNPGFGADSTIWAIAVDERNPTNRVIYVAGDFYTFDGQTRYHIARLKDDGSLDPNFDPGLGADSSIYALALQTDGKILIGGRFTMYHTFFRNSLARLNPDGSLDESYNIGVGADNSIYTIKLQPDGKALIGGVFTSFNYTRRMGMARIYTSGVLDTSFMDTAYNHFAGLPKTFSFDSPSFVNSIALQSNGDLMVGGSFTNVGGNLSVHYATTNFSTLPVEPNSTNRFFLGYYYAPINGRTNNHNSGAHIFAPFTRQDKTTRFNVARIHGGYTPGPGNIEYDPNSTFTANENNGSLTVTLRRVDGRLGTAAAIAATTNNTATFPVDFTTSISTQLWGEWRPTVNAVAAGLTSPRSVGYVGPGYFSIPLVDDNLQEGDETFGLVLSNAFGSITLGGEYIPLGPALGHTDLGQATLADNDFDKGIFNFAISGYVTNENAGFAVISVIRTNGTSGSVTVEYMTRDASALAGQDYTTTRGTLRFASGQSNASFNIPIFNDEFVEFDETVTLILTNATGGAKLPGGLATSIVTNTLTIIDNDFLPGRLNFSTSAFTNNENEVYGQVKVTRAGGNVGAMTVQVHTLNGGTATPNVDYTPTTNTLTWNDGESGTKTVLVPLASDGVVEGTESVLVRLMNPSVSGSLGSRTNATLWIQDGDAYGTLTFNQTYYEADENGSYPVITVLRRGGSAGTVSVNYQTAGIIAVPGADYVETSGTLTFAPGEFSKTFVVPIIDNGAPDGDRTLQITLSNPVNTTIGPITNVVLNIVDNESINLPAGSIDTTFSSTLAPDGAVYSLVQQLDGRIIAAGDFTKITGVPRNHLARLKPGGTLDTTFDIGPGANGSIRAMVLDSFGKLVLGGAFTTVNSTNRNGIARLSTDGSLDSSFNPGAGADNPVFALAIQPNDKLLVGGSFSTFNNIIRPGIARLNTNGTVDTSFLVGAGVNGTVFAIALQNDGKVLVGGDFISYNGVARTNLIRLLANGSLDTTFNPALYLDAAVRTIHVENDGRIVIGGSFTNVNGASRGHLARLLGNGQLDTSFMGNASLAGADNTVYAIKQQVDGKLVVAGDFKVFHGVTRNGITRLHDSDGSTDPTINFGNGADGFVAALVIQPDRRIIIGGGFTHYDDQPRQYIARIYGGSITGAGTLEYSAPQFIASESGTNAVIAVRRRGGTSADVSVNYATADGSARAGIDYLATAGTLNFPTGETRLVFNVPILTNTVADGDRTVNLTLSNFVGAGAGLQPFSTLIILDDESTVGFATPNYAANELPVSANATIQLVRSGATNTTVSVGIFTSDVSALAGLDYVATNGVVTFLPGERTKNFNVRILDDAIIEANETVSLSLTNPSGFTALAISNATLTIVDNDFGPGQFIFQTNNFVVDEGGVNAVVTVLRTNGTTGVVGVRLTTSDGTALNGSDYVATNRVLTFADNETAKSINVRILEDTNAEPDETINLTLSNPTGGATILGSNAVVTIADNELTPSYVGFLTNNFFVNEFDPFATITVVRTNSRRGQVSVNFSVSNGSATAGLDYIITNGTITFLENEVAKTFTVPILNDILGEGPETVRLSLSGLVATNTAFISLPTSTLTIVEDDATVHFSQSVYGVAENQTNALVTVLRTGVLTNTVSVDYAATGSNAVAGLDFTPVSGTLTFVPGQSSNGFLVPIIDNTGINPARVVYLALANLVGPTNTYFEAPSNAVLVITNDETANPVAGIVDPSFAGNIGANGTVHAVAYDAQQNLYVGGEFTRFWGLDVNRITRLTTNGAVDVTFRVGGGADAPVYAVAPATNGVYIGGAFTNVNGVARPGIACLTTNGTVDVTFTTGLGLNGAVRSIAVAGSQVYVVGDFTSYNGLPVARLARLGQNGTLDNSFAISSGANGSVRAVAVQANGQVIIGGDFTTVNGFSATRLARLNADGSFDSTFNIGLGADDTVRSIVIQPDGRIVLGGAFFTFNGVPRSHVVRLNSNGTVDLTFNPGSGFAGGDVRSVALQGDGRLVVGGSFTSVAGNSFNRIARLNTDGSLDAYLNVGTGANAAVNSVATFTIAPPTVCSPPGVVFLGFDSFSATNFTGIPSFTTNCVTFFGPTGGVFHAVSNTVSGGTAVQLLATDGGLMELNAGGLPFSLFSMRILALSGPVVVTSSSGGQVVITQTGFPFFDSTFSDVQWVRIQTLSGTVTLDDIFIFSSPVPPALPTDRVALGGDFTKVNELPRGRVAQLDFMGSVDATFDPGAISTHAVYAIDTYTNLAQPALIGKVLAGGDFTVLVGVEGVNRVGRLNMDGTIDKSFNSGVGANDVVRAVAVQPDGKAIIGGFFTTYDFISRPYLARLNADGTLDNNFNFGVSLDAPVLAIALQPDGRIIVGGNFTTIYGAPRAFIGRVNTNGTVDTNFVSSADGPVHAVALQPDGKVVIGGEFTSVNGTLANGIARLNADGSTDTSFNAGIGADGVVNAVALTADGHVLVGGAFTHVNGFSVSRLARLNSDGSFDSSFNAGAAANNIVNAIKVQRDGKILVAGNFTSFYGQVRNRIVRLTPNGALDPAINFGLGANNFIAAEAIQTYDDKILVGGGFTMFDVEPRVGIARLFGGDNSGSGAFQFAITNYTVNERSNTVTLAIVRSGGTAGAASVNYATANGTATAPQHYTTTSGTLSFADAESVKYITVPIIDNAVTNVNRSFTVTLSAPVGASLASNTVATVTILDNDSAISFSAASYTVSENGGAARITVVRSGGATDTVTADFATGTNGSATANVDFTPRSVRLVFNPGVRVLTVDVPVTDDTINEFNETVPLSLANVAGPAVLGLSSATLTIVENEFGPGVITFGTNSYSISEDGVSIVIDVYRTNGHSGIATVAFATLTNGTATSGVDYFPTNGTLTFADGQTNASFVVRLNDDTTIEGNETLALNLFGPSGGATLGIANATLTIVDNDAPGQFVFLQPDYFVNETGVVANITILRTNGNVGNVGVTFYTSGGSATAGQDYTAVSNTLTFGIGQTVRTVQIPILNDALIEGTETVGLILANPTGGATVGTPTALLNIFDDEIAVSFAQAGFVVTEGFTNAIITLVRLGDTNSAVSVGANTSDGTATGFVDYLPTITTLNFAPGETNKTFLVAILDDTIPEGNEFFNVTLSNPSQGVTVQPIASAQVTIVDDDISFNFSQPVYTVTEGNVFATITVVRSGSLTPAVSVSYQTTDGTATGGFGFGGDYVTTSNTLTFASGVATQSFNVQILDDFIVEGDETVRLSLFNPTPGTFLGGQANAVINIVDNDTVIAFTSTNFIVNEKATNAIVTLTRSGVATAAVTVRMRTTNGTALANIDYTSVNTIVSWGANDTTTKTVLIPVTDDGVSEGVEIVNLLLETPTGGATIDPTFGTATLSIVDNAGAIAFAAATYNVVEGDGNAILNLVRSGGSNGVVSVNWTAAGGSATANQDYFGTSGTVVFADGELQKPILLPINDDGTIEGFESVNISLSGAAGGARVGSPSTATLRILDNDAGVIVGSGSALIAESFTPTNSVIESNEVVTLLFGLRNAGTLDDTITATLVFSNGIGRTNVAITNLQQQSYGLMPASGGTISRPFTFRALGSNGTRITAQLLITNAAGVFLGDVTFNYTIGRQVIPFANAGQIVIPLQGPANPFPSTLTVSGVSGPVNKLTVTLYNVSHNFPDDLELILVSPDGRKALLMNDSGGGGSAGNPNALVNRTLTFDDAAEFALPDSGVISNGTYRCASYGLVTAPFPSPGPQGPYQTNLAVFNGANPNGVWSLYVHDDGAFENGRIDGGWSLSIQTAEPVVPGADLAIGVVGTPNPVATNGVITYNITITNFGPSAASSVTVTSTLPDGVSFITAFPGRGLSGNTVLLDFGNLPVGGVTNGFIQVAAPGVAGQITFVSTVGAGEVDLNTGNSTVAAKVSVYDPTSQPTPVLFLSRKSANVVLTWQNETNVVLEAKPLMGAGSWATVSNGVTVSNGAASVTEPLSGGSKFYRLKRR